jgi:uncharacterized spore protein YtfJ
MAGADEVKAELEANAQTSAFIERLAQRVGATAGAKAVFGEVVERDGVSVIPVARAVWGFGGGGGTSAGEEGAGGGGGGAVRPIGYIEVRSGEASFRPIRDPRLLGAAAVAVAIAAAGVAQIARARLSA